MRVESNLQLHWCCFEQFSIECRKLSDMDWFRFTLLCDWSRQPVRCKTKTNYILVTRVFPRFLLWVFIGSLRVFSFLLIGRRCDNFGLVLQHSLKCALLHVFKLVRENCTTLSTSQMQNWKKLQFVLTYFPALQAVCLFFL